MTETAGQDASGAVEHPGVQRVLQDLDGLEQRPVGEHAAVYQDAHERLTRELDSAESRIAGTAGAAGAAGTGGAGGAGRASA